MKLTFVAHRANYLKHYGSLIDAALARGWQVDCLVDVTQDAGTKAYLNLSEADLAAIWGTRIGIVGFTDMDECRTRMLASQADAFVSLHARSLYFAAGQDDTPFITLQHSVDSFIHNTPEDLLSSDYLCFFSEYWWDYMLEYYQRAGEAISAQQLDALRQKVVFTGFAQMDVLDIIDHADVRRRWAIPPEQPVILWMPLDLEGWPGEWPAFMQAPNRLAMLRHLWRGLRREGLGFLASYWRWVLQGWNDDALTRAIRQFADANGAFLLVKGREKHPLRPGVLAAADLALYDEDHYPATALEAVAIADLVMVFYSTAAQEAVYAGVPALCIDRPNRDIIKHQMWRSSAAGGPYNFAGAVDWMTIPDAIRRLPGTDLDSFVLDEDARQRYLALYMGAPDCAASERILDLLKEPVYI